MRRKAIQSSSCSGEEPLPLDIPPPPPREVPEPDPVGLVEEVKAKVEPLPRREPPRIVIIEIPEERPIPPPPPPEDDADLSDLPSPPRRKTRAKRRLIPCHLCLAKVQNLTRHIREVHRVLPARMAKNPQGYIVRECPIAGCRKVYPRIAQHLRKYHKIDSRLIKSLVNKSKPVVLSPER